MSTKYGEEEIGSQLFRPFRALGFVCGNLPFSVSTFKTESLICCSIGKSIHTYTSSKLECIFVGQHLQRKIRCLSHYKNFNVAASGSTIYFLKRGKIAFDIPVKSKVKLMQVFGDHLIIVDKDRRLSVISIGTKEEIASHDFPFTFTPTTLLHPHTYLNKIIVGSEEGTFQLWNIKKMKLIFEFKGFGSKINCLAQSPVLDVIGFGLADGRIAIHNLKFDKTITVFSQGNNPVTTLSFRSDKHPILASGGNNGQIFIWDLEKKVLKTIVNNAHTNNVTHLQFLPSEPVLVSSSDDNSLKMWIFDLPDGSGRLLRSRSGHSLPPTFIRYYKTGQQLISTGEDHSLRVFHTFRDRQNKELSQGNIESKAKKLNRKEMDLKFPVVKSIDFNPVRERDWDNIVTCHRNSKTVRLWSFDRFAIGKKKIVLKRAASAVAVSSCGNFCVIGDENGFLHKYNMQSAILRASSSSSHSSPITNIFIDLLNLFVITTSLDSSIKYWEFGSLKEKEGVETPSPIEKAIFHRESNLLATISEDQIIRVFDVETKKIVRVFSGHKQQITDIVFNNDSRWIISSSLDKTVRVWDLVSGKMIDWFLVETPVTSLAFSPTGEFLSTTHLGDIGIYLWSNKSYFSNVFFHPPSEKPSFISLPKITKDIVEDTEKDNLKNGKEKEDNKEEEEDQEMNIENENENGEREAKRVKLNENENENEENNNDLPNQLSKLLTFSKVPRTRIKTLVNLEIIKERNKPTEAPKAKTLAPFLLPTVSGLDPKFATDENKKADENSSATPLAGQSRILNLGLVKTTTPFMKSLEDGREAGDYTESLKLLSAMSPSAIDLEIRQLISEDDVGLLFDFIEYSVGECVCFELVQALLNVLLKVHGDIILQSEFLLGRIDDIKEAQSYVWDRLEGMFHYNQCLISYLSGIQF